MLEWGATVAIIVFGAALAFEGRRRWSILCFGLTCAGITYGYNSQVDQTDLSLYRPADQTLPADSRFSSSRACRSCHQATYASWHDSHHRRMTQPPLAENIVAPFDGRTLIDGPRSYRVFMRGDEYAVNMPKYGTNGLKPAQRQTLPVVMTTGSHHMQAFWLPVPWFEQGGTPKYREAFNANCATCHGHDGRGGVAPSVIDGGMTDQDTARFITGPAHPALEIEEADLEGAITYVQGVQYTGRLMQFPFVYLVKHQRWVHEEHTFLQPPPPPEPVEHFGDRWSEGCDQCHSVHPSFRWSGTQRAGSASVAELGIACEACHGAGRQHAANHRNPFGRYWGRFFGFGEDDIVRPRDLDHRRASGLCAQCHGELVLKDNFSDFEPGKDLLDYAHVLEYLPEAPPAWLKEAIVDEPRILQDSFWRDGTIRIAGRDFNGLVKTGCYTAGEMSCITCHAMHGSDRNDQLKASAKGDAVCVECHEGIGGAVEAHTHHDADSSGSHCYNCHMPHTTAGLLGLIRAHRVDSPNANVTQRTGRPNACNLCHLKKSLTEVADNLSAWYGHAPLAGPDPAPDMSYILDLLLRGDAVQRATAAWHMSWTPAMKASGDDWQAPYLAELLDDPYSAIRAIAGESLKKLPTFSDFNYDYVGNKADQEAGRKKANDHWTRTTATLENDAAVLLTAQGVDRNRVTQLKSQRDDRPIRVNE